MKEWIIGRNPVYEILRTRRRKSFQIKIARGVEERGRIEKIKELASQFNVPIDYVERHQLNAMGDNHQGVAIEVSAYPYADLEDIFELAASRKEALFVLILDVLQDPQNFGTLIRSAEAFGVHGIIIPFNRAVGVIPSVVHASSGASEHMLIAQANLAQSITALKQNEVWVLGMELSARAQSIETVDLSGNLAVVIGSEGKGLRELTRNSCDFLAKLPMVGNVASLNAATAGSIVLYLAYKSRKR